MPYCFPSSWYGLRAAGMIVLAHDEVAAVRSWTFPASTCCLRPPPPHDWKMSGGVPLLRARGSFVLKSSFWVGVISKVTLGWAAVYSSATFCQNDLPGSWLALCHQVITTGAA